MWIFKLRKKSLCYNVAVNLLYVNPNFTYMTHKKKRQQKRGAYIIQKYIYKNIYTKIYAKKS